MAVSTFVLISADEQKAKLFKQLKQIQIFCCSNFPAFFFVGNFYFSFSALVSEANPAVLPVRIALQVAA